MKLKHALAAAAVTMAFAAPAMALDSPSTGNGGLFLTAWDASTNATIGYARDLGMTMDQFLLNPNVDLNFAADATFVNTFAGVAASNIRWNVTAGDRVVDPNRLLSTGAVDPGTITNGALNNAVLGAQIPLATDLNGRGIVPGTSVTQGVADAADPDRIWGPNWGANFGGQMLNINNAAALGGSLGFYLITQNGLTETSLTVQATQNQFFVDLGTQAKTFAGIASAWTLNSDGSLSFNGTDVSPSAVPLPAAAWLFGSGLLGLVGVSRRKAKVAA
jgi:hypothetical protein